MEEIVGRWWHNAVVRWTNHDHVDAAVSLDEMLKTIGILFRAAGGSTSLRFAPSSDQKRGGYRSLLQKLAGSDTRANIASLEPDVLALPSRIAVFPSRAMNHDLYLWLSIQAAVFEATGNWLLDNQIATTKALGQFPGFQSRYGRLLEAHLAQRAPTSKLHGLDRTQELAVQSALRGEPVSVESFPVVPGDVAPVWLWLNGQHAATIQSVARNTSGDRSNQDRPDTLRDGKRRRTQRISETERKAPMVLPFRVESLLTWSEHINLNRADDDEDDGNALTAADDMDTLTVATNGEALAARVKFDLDLPSSSADDIPVGEGIVLPEWDFHRGQLVDNHCSVQKVSSRETVKFIASPALRLTARQLRRRLEVLRDVPRPLFGQESGDSLDLDAWVRHSSDLLGSVMPRTDTPAVYVRQGKTQRSLSTLLLADLSLSTDAYASNEQRVIEVIRDALYVFGEGLGATGDAFAMWGFSSVRRQHVRLNHLKSFDDDWNEACKGRIGAIRPGYYTRMGAAIRFATRELQIRPERRKLLMLLTDGKPNDLDVYEGRYGIEDTRQAIHEARLAGLSPFCVTIDAAGHDYLPYLFGKQGYALVHRPTDLVKRLTQAWATLAH